jgi:hypothetical protein
MDAKHTHGRQLKKGLARRSWPKKENKKMDDSPVIEIKIPRVPKSEFKEVGGGDRDQWNKRLVEVVSGLFLSSQKTPRPFHKQAPPSWPE